MAKHWLFLHRIGIKAWIRIIFGVVWFTDSLFKFQAGVPQVFSQLITSAGQGQPAWLMPWFNFWAGVVGSSPDFWVYLIGAAEMLIGLALIFGVLRKITYIMGALLSLFIWAIPEGFGGPYGPSSTDIGTGIIYALVFLCLMVINAGYGPSKYSIDAWIEKRVKWWRKLAEFGG